MNDEPDINSGFMILPTADVQLSEASARSVIMTFDSFERTKAAEDVNIRKVEVRERTLLKIKSCADRLAQNEFPWSEVLLAISTTALGAVVGAIASGLGLSTTFGQIFYVAASSVFVGAGVGYFFRRYVENQNPRLPMTELKNLISDIFGNADEARK